MPPQMLELIQEILFVRCESSREEELREYLLDIEDPIYTNIPEFRTEIYPKLKLHLLKVIISLHSKISFRE